MGAFDVGAFFSALDVTRNAKNLSWRGVAKEIGISASTLTRLAQGRHPDVNSLALLATWAGLQVDDFIDKGTDLVTAEPLTAILTNLRSDPNLTSEAANALDQIIRAAYEQLRSKDEQNEE